MRKFLILSLVAIVLPVATQAGVPQVTQGIKSQSAATSRLNDLSFYGVVHSNARQASVQGTPITMSRASARNTCMLFSSTADRVEPLIHGFSPSVNSTITRTARHTDPFDDQFLSRCDDILRQQNTDEPVRLYG